MSVITFQPSGRFANNLFQYFITKIISINNPQFEYIFNHRFTSNDNVFTVDESNYIDVLNMITLIPPHCSINVVGYFQNYEIINKYKEVILNTIFTETNNDKFTLNNYDTNCISATISELVKYIKNNSHLLQQNKDKLIVHIRLGDYEDKITNVHILTNLIYKITYNDEIKEVVLITDRYNRPQDIQYIQLLQFHFPCMKVTTGTIMDDFSTIYYATRIICSNSTFSWMAVFLGNNNKVNYVPNKWYTHTQKLTKIDDNTITYDCDEDFSSKTCIYVSTRGIAESCYSRPVWNNGPHFPSDYIARYCGEHLGNNLNTIYLQFGQVNSFVESMLPHITTPFIVITGYDDNDTREPIFQSILNHPLLIKLYSQNCFEIHPKLHSLPIGLDYHTLSVHNPNQTWSKITPLTPKEQEWQILHLKKTMRPLNNTIPKVCTNFHHSMSEPELRRERREPIYRYLYDKDYMLWLPQSDRLSFYKILDHFAFCLCPIGNGYDTYRLWETVVLGRIAIVQRIKDFGSMYDDLPIIQVDNWEDINEEYLQEKYNEVVRKLDNNEYKLEKLTLKYWIDLINSA